MKVKNFIYLTITFILFSNIQLISQTQNQSFSPNNWIIQSGVGFVSNGLKGDMEIPPINVAIEKGINETMAIGAYIGYAKFRYVAYKAGYIFSQDVGFDYGYTIIAGSISNHFSSDSPELDLYGRVYLGYVLVSASTFGLGSFNGSAQENFAAYGAYLGATYYLTSGFGINGEVGYGNVAIIRVGLSLKFWEILINPK